jgi:hypothetical protein
MSAQPAYHFPVEHPPPFLAHGLSPGTRGYDRKRKRAVYEGLRFDPGVLLGDPAILPEG